MDYQTKKSNSILLGLFKFSLITLLIGSLTYMNYGRIKSMINKFRYSGIEAEIGYVSKDIALNSKIIHEKNSYGNLETYLLTEKSKLPVLARENGLMVGYADYNWDNFTNQEKLDLMVNNWSNLDDAYKNQLIREEIGKRIKNKYHELKDFLLDLFNFPRGENELN